MTKKFRRLLFYIFLLAFLVITPLLSFYAAGYKFSKGFSLQKTGLFIINTKPDGAFVYLNGKKQTNFLGSLFAKEKQSVVTPAKIKGVLPGEYNVLIEKEGYWPWQKKLTIEPGQTVFAEDVVLFKKDIPLLISAHKYGNISVSPNEKLAVGITNKDATLIDISGREKEKIASTSESLSQVINWLDNESLLAGSQIFSTKSWDSPISLISGVGTSPEQIKWDKDKDNFVYYLSNNSLFNYNFKTKTSKEVISGRQIKDYTVKNGLVYFIEQNVLGSFLNVWSEEENKLIRSINLPTSEYSLDSEESDLINIYDQRHKILLLVDPFTSINPLKETINDVEKSLWIDKQKILYTNGYEIWLFTLDNFQKTLLTRISENITDIFWHPTNNYILYCTKNNINILELDNRDRYNITTILELDNIQDPYLSRDGQMLYFYGQIGNQFGIFKLVIQ